ncbi:MAG: alkaline phosphatase D family protein [Acidobacteria bacterium]|nr:alkaline phosphatase D family protein [Acidobacteriota bacterium]
MRVVMGPVLSLRRAEVDRWLVSALVVAARTPAVQPLEVKRGDSHAGDAVKVAAKELWVRGTEAVYRYDMAVPLDARRATHVEYRFAGNEESWSFCVPPADGKPKMAFVSCNGFASASEMKKVEDKNRLWRRLAALHAEGPYHVLIMGGDQVYADQLWEECSAIRMWVETSFEKRRRRRFTREMDAQVRRFYFNLYRDRWRQPEVESMMSSVPTVMMWDDHDIFDGWGSYDPDIQTCDVYQGIFGVAREHFAVFQQQLDPRIGEDHPSRLLGGSGFTLAFELGDYAVLALDARSERSQRRVLSRDTWDAVWSWTETLPAAGEGGPRHLLLVVGVPVLHADFGALERVMGWLPGDQALEDDVRDHWQSSGHRTERLRLVHRLLDLMRTKKIRTTIVSGDVHVACLGAIESERSGARGQRSSVINQLTASGIVHPPPPKLLGYLLERLSEEAEPIDRGITGTMLAFPGKRKKFVLERNFLSLEPDERDDRLWANWWLEQDEDGPATKVIGPVPS